MTKSMGFVFGLALIQVSSLSLYYLYGWVSHLSALNSNKSAIYFHQ